MHALRDVLDPEWPVSIVDLGLVRSIDVEDGVAHVRLAPTSTACPCLDWIAAMSAADCSRSPASATCAWRSCGSRGALRG